MGPPEAAEEKKQCLLGLTSQGGGGFGKILDILASVCMVQCLFFAFFHMYYFSKNVRRH